MVDVPTVPVDSFTLECDRTADGEEVSTAVAELATGETIRLRIADHFVMVSELSGVRRDLTILTRPVRVDVESVTVPRITTPAVRHSQRSVEARGSLEATGVDPVHGSDARFDVLDVGIGSIDLHPAYRDGLPESEGPIRAGDQRSISASPIEVWEISP